MMLEELERRNYSQSTVRTYVRTIRDLARYFNRPPDQLGPDQLREYQAYLFRERKLAANTVNQRTAALRFLGEGGSVLAFLGAIRPRLQNGDFARSLSDGEK